jgi:hypothetical protein
VTEQEWFEGEEPGPMLGFLLRALQERCPLGVEQHEWEPYTRKMTLFAAACCRRIWDLLHSESSRNAVAVAERFVDGHAEYSELEEADAAGSDAWIAFGEPAAKAALCVTNFSDTDPADAAADAARLTVEALPLDWAIRHDERGFQTDLVRDIFGNPFRPITVESAWVTPTVTTLASAAYEERTLPSGELDPARLAVLADALEEVGCDNADMLNHLRSPGTHVRGCWVVDLLLAKE